MRGCFFGRIILAHKEFKRVGVNIPSTYKTEIGVGFNDTWSRGSDASKCKSQWIKYWLPSMHKSQRALFDRRPYNGL